MKESERKFSQTASGLDDESLQRHVDKQAARERELREPIDRQVWYKALAKIKKDLVPFEHELAYRQEAKKHELWAQHP